MAAWLNAGPLAPSGSNSNTTHAAYQTNPNATGHALQFVVESVGATPTITYKFQGSADGLVWYDILYVLDSTDTAATTARTVTTVGGTIQFISNPVARVYEWVRCVTSANTNVVYRAEIYETTK